MANTAITYFKDKFYMNGDFCIKRKAFRTSQKHTHDFIEIVYIIKGKGTHAVDGRSYPVSSGDLLYINYGCTHSFESIGGFDYFEILMKPEFVSEGLRGSENAFSLLTIKDFNEFADSVNKDNCLVSFSGEERKTLESVINLTYGEVENGKQGSHLILSSALNILLTLIFRKMSLPMHKEGSVDAKLLNYIKENCHTHITLEQLAERCSYNPAYFSRMFKSYAGVTFSEYLTVCRMERAKELLCSTEMPVESIIGESGYSNRTKFFADFMKNAGCTPLNFRKSKK